MNSNLTKDKSDLQKPIFAHYEIGKNDYPLTKIEDFSKIMDEGGLGSVLDISLMKFCFVDIHSNTDIEDVFNAYKKNNRIAGTVSRAINCFLFKLGLRVTITPPKTNRIPIYGIIGIGEKLAHPKPRLKIL